MSKNYIASIITPFHNTNLAFFKKGFESVCNQTVGVENIEWLIVVHNSEPSYLEGVKEMTAGHDNFKVFELNNEIRSASSPRNYAMDRATGKYIFFLDSDDYFTKCCIKEVTDRMEKANAVYAKIRAEKAVEDETVIEFVDHRVRYDQTRDMIILKKGDPEIKNIVGVNCMTPWSQAFSREFLDDNNLRYDLNIALGEDMDFTLRAMKYADSILLLPQTIGYVYYINHASTLQQMGDVSVESIMGLAGGLTYVNKLGIDSGLDVRYLFWEMLNTVSGLILSAPLLDEEQFDQLKSMISPLLDIVEPLDADGKFYTEAMVEEITGRCRAMFGSDTAEHVSEEVTDNVLLSILRGNIHTDIGRRYEFNLIHNHQAYESRVPVSDYSFYEPLVELTTRVGEDRIFCENKVLGYALTAGATGRVKRIPFTKRHLQFFIHAMYTLNGGPGGRKGSTFAMFPYLPKDFRNEDNTYNNMIIGAALEYVANDMPDNSHEVKNKEGYLTSPRELLFPDETFNPRHTRLLFALSDPDVTQIAAPYCWTVLEAFEYLEKNHEQLIEDMRTGEIHFSDSVSEETQKKITSRFHANPERADALEAIFNAGFDEPVIPKIWPNLERIVAAGTGAFQIYRDRLKRYTGDTVEFFNGFYATSEAFIGISVGAGNDCYKLITGYDYFEFLPAGTDPSEGLVRPENLIPGNEYEVVVTNHAGLYRYRLDDVICVDHMEKGVPVFKFVRKANQTCETCGVRLNEDDVYRIVKWSSERSGIDFADYAYGVDENNSCFRIWLEPSSVGESYEKAVSATKKEIESYVDEAFSKELDEYKSAREEGRLNMVELYILEPETQIMKRDRDMYLRKWMPDQMKPIRVVNDEQTEKFLMALSK